MTGTPDREAATDAGESADTRDESRREALRRMAKYGAYTAPFLLAVLSSEPAAAAESTKT